MSGFYRDESEIRDFGNGRDSFQSATDLSNTVWNAQAKYTMSGQKFLSETDGRLQRLQVEFRIRQTPISPGRNYFDAVRLGAATPRRTSTRNGFGPRGLFRF
jgi:hypothetical protein